MLDFPGALLFVGLQIWCLAIFTNQKLETAQRIKIYVYTCLVALLLAYTTYGMFAIGCNAKNSIPIGILTYVAMFAICYRLSYLAVVRKSLSAMSLMMLSILGTPFYFLIFAGLAMSTPAPCR